MAPKTNNPPRPSPQTIPLIYRLFFTYLEPLFALNGAYLYFFAPTRLLRIITPPPLHPPPQEQRTPVETMLLWQVGSLYILFALVELVLLRRCGPDVWRVIMAAVLCSSDCGHLVALKLVADRAGGAQSAWWWDPREWGRWEDWGNQGLTWFGAGLRVAFLLRVGF